MRERGMIFNADMVRAVLNGSKTQTRRIIKNQRVGDSWSVQPAQNPRTNRHTHDWWLPTGTQPYSALPACPFGAIGDRLWVRETFSIVPRTAYAASEGVQQVICPDDNHEAAIFRAGWEHSTGGIRWRPSIHMPRWASRITLEITGVRVERLTALSDDDARNEGCPAQLPHNPEDEHQARTWFRGLWSEIYGEESWQANPWVWVIEFKRVEGE